MQGPCEENEIFVITQKNTLPKCVENECGVVGQVKFNEECTEFKSELACLKMLNNNNLVLPRKKMKLEVDPSSHQLACTDEANGIFCDKHQCKIVNTVGANSVNTVYHNNNAFPN